MLSEVGLFLCVKRASECGYVCVYVSDKERRRKKEREEGRGRKREGRGTKRKK